MALAHLLRKNLVVFLAGCGWWSTSAASAASAVSIIHQFSARNSDGRYPQAAVILAPNGWLYGTTPTGGQKNQGTVYRLRPSGQDFTTLYHFTKLNGDAGGAVGRLWQSSNRTFYALTEAGGQAGVGTVYRIDEDGSNFTILRSFEIINSDGKGPSAGLIEGADGLLYGTADFGGAYNQGTVFVIAKDGSGYATLHSFQGTFLEGAKPQTALLQAKEGFLLGTTSGGGQHGRGTVFRLKPDGSDFQTLHHFAGGHVDGQMALSALIEDSTGTIYGTTRAGGTPAQGGAIYALQKDGSGFRIVRGFTGLNNEPGVLGNGLVLATDKKLFGTSLRGGQHGKGTVFAINTDGTDLEVLHPFAGLPSDGASPLSPLVKADKNTFYGTTERGGPEDAGTVYRLVLEQ